MRNGSAAMLEVSIKRLGIMVELLGPRCKAAVALGIYNNRKANGEDVAVYTPSNRFDPVVLNRK